MDKPLATLLSLGYMNLVIKKEYNKKCIYLGETPDIYDDDSWSAAEKLFKRVWSIIKDDFPVSKGKNKNSFVINSEEFSIFTDDLMPLGIYPENISGNCLIEEIFIALKSKL